MSRKTRPPIFIAFVLVLFSHSEAAENDGKAPAVDTAILTLMLSADAKVIIDGRDYGTQRHFTFSPLKRDKRYKVEVSVIFANEKRVTRSVYLEGGWNTELPIQSPGSAGPLPFVQIGQVGPALRASYHPNGNLAIVSGIPKEVLWDLRSGRQLKTFHTGTKFTFHPDGHRVAFFLPRESSSSLEGIIHLQNFETEEMVQIIRVVGGNYGIRRVN